MPLHPQAKAIVDAEIAAGLAPLETLTGEQARARAKARPVAAPPAGMVARTSDRLVAGPDGNEVPVRVYRPGDEAGLPLLIWFHGGGWVTGDIESNDAVCHMLAVQAGAVVVSVAYRLAPEHPFPAGVEDAYAVTKWAADHAEELGGRPGVLAVGGASAGGNLAAAVALMARERQGPALVHQLLVYPVTDCNFESASYERNGEGYGLSRASMRWYWRQYLGEELAEAGNPLAAPLRCPDLSGLPRAHVITAEYDPLCDEGEEYARRLEEEGVMTVATRYPGMIHGFFGQIAALDDSPRAIAEAANQLRISVAAAAMA